MANTNIPETTEKIRNALAILIPYKECDYRNSIIARIIAKGRAEDLTEDRIKKMLVTDAEDGFITYGQAITLQKEYRNAIDILKMLLDK